MATEKCVHKYCHFIASLALQLRLPPAKALGAFIVNLKNMLEFIAALMR